MRIKQLVVQDCMGIEYNPGDASLFLSHEQHQSLCAFVNDGAEIQSGSIEILGQWYERGDTFSNHFPRRVVWLKAPQTWVIGSTARQELSWVISMHRTIKLDLIDVMAHYQLELDFEKWDEPTHELSREEQAQLVLMRALLMQPKLIFLEGEYIELSQHQSFFDKIRALDVKVLSVHKANV